MKKKTITFLLALALISVVVASQVVATEKLNINTATLEELMSLKGIGDAKAEAIIEYREAHGPFKCIEDLKNVKGIGDQLFDSIKSEITIEEITIE